MRVLILILLLAVMRFDIVARGLLPALDDFA
jgi:hypothetical protein